MKKYFKNVTSYEDMNCTKDSADKEQGDKASKEGKEAKRKPKTGGRNRNKKEYTYKKCFENLLTMTLKSV